MPFCYKIGLIRTLLDWTYRTNNPWSGFNSDIQKVFNILKKNCFPLQVTERSLNRYLNIKLRKPESVCTLNGKDKPTTFYYKLPFIGSFSSLTQKRLHFLTKHYCRNINIQVVFTTFKIGRFFSPKESISKGSRSRVVYKFVW